MEVVALAFGDLRSIAGGLTIRAHNKQHRKNNTKMLLPMLLAKTKDHLPTSSTLSRCFFIWTICERGFSIRPQTLTAQHLSGLSLDSYSSVCLLSRDARLPHPIAGVRWAAL